MGYGYRIPLILGVTLSLGPALAASADFVAYESKDSVREGTGGEKKTVDGVDFWANGAPPRKFQIIGFITDSRLKTGLIGMMRMSGLESSIAKEAKKAGGDAVILTDASAETTGYVGASQMNTHVTSNTSGNFNATTSGNTTNGTFGGTTNTQASSFGTHESFAVKKQHSKYAVVKYLPDDSNAVAKATQ